MPKNLVLIINKSRYRTCLLCNVWNFIICVLELFSFKPFVPNHLDSSSCKDVFQNLKTIQNINTLLEFRHFGKRIFCLDYSSSVVGIQYEVLLRSQPPCVPCCHTSNSFRFCSEQFCLVWNVYLRHRKHHSTSRCCRISQLTQSTLIFPTCRRR